MQPSSQVLSAFVLDGQGGGRAIDAGGTARWKPGEGVLWVVVGPNAREGTGVGLRETMGVSEVTCEALLAEDTRPRCLHSQGGLLIILRAVNMNPGAEPDDLVTLRVWLDAEKVICLRGRRCTRCRTPVSGCCGGAGRGPPAACWCSWWTR